jgi:hypothetical protein
VLQHQTARPIFGSSKRPMLNPELADIEPPEHSRAQAHFAYAELLSPHEPRAEVRRR